MIGEIAAPIKNEMNTSTLAGYTVAGADAREHYVDSD